LKDCLKFGFERILVIGLKRFFNVLLEWLFNIVTKQDRHSFVELIIFSEKCDSAYANFREYSSILFYFQCKNIFFEKNNFCNISALYFLNYFMPNLLPGNGNHKFLYTVCCFDGSLKCYLKGHVLYFSSNRLLLVHLVPKGSRVFQ
jgi:hypothetical protein